MSTQNLGLAELIAHQRQEEVERGMRHVWHLTDFWRNASRKEQIAVHHPRPSWRGELVEWGMTSARLAML